VSESLRLALFDIDGTLVRGGWQLRAWFGEALVEVFGEAGDLDGYSFAGKIDPQIVMELLSGAGLPRAEIEAGLPSFQKSYLGRLQRHLSRDHLRLLPHVESLLERLSRRGEITLGLLTGNWELGARAKLSCYGLNRFFSFGSFGDGQQSRRDLPPLALDRAAAVTGRRFLPAETVIVGDSSLDVECAHEHGMRAAAVATGPASRAELESAGADWVLPDLGEAHRVHPIFRI
jgi:phosphoglycolate phosphatase-like HAD superfamily hydrolase